MPALIRAIPTNDQAGGLGPIIAGARHCDAQLEHAILRDGQRQQRRCAFALCNFLRGEDFPAQRLPLGSGQAQGLLSILTHEDGPRQHALGPIAGGSERVEDSNKNLRLDGPQMSEPIPIFGIHTQTPCTFENVHGSYTRRAEPGCDAKRMASLTKRARAETIRVCSVDTRAFASHDFMFFGAIRPEPRPGTKRGGYRFHQCGFQRPGRKNTIEP